MRGRGRASDPAGALSVCWPNSSPFLAACAPEGLMGLPLRLDGRVASRHRAQTLWRFLTFAPVREPPQPPGQACGQPWQARASSTRQHSCIARR